MKPLFMLSMKTNDVMYYQKNSIAWSETALIVVKETNYTPHEKYTLPAGGKQPHNGNRSSFHMVGRKKLMQYVK